MNHSATSHQASTSKAAGPLCTALAGLLTESDSAPSIRKVGAPPSDPSRPNAEAVAASHYPTRDGEAVDWSQPLYDSEGYEHRLVELGGIQVVTRMSFAFAVWDRKSLTLVGPDVGQDQTIGNTPLSDRERERRRDVGRQLLDGHRTAASDSDSRSEPDEPRGPSDTPQG